MQALVEVDSQLASDSLDALGLAFLTLLLFLTHAEDKNKKKVLLHSCWFCAISFRQRGRTSSQTNTHARIRLVTKHKTENRSRRHKKPQARRVQTLAA
jgi:hypothetical protein